MPQNISAEPLAQMVRSITLQKRTGILQVEQLGGRGAERGEIYFQNGSLVRVRTEHETGKAAFQRISEWRQITCSFHSLSRPPYPAQARITTTVETPPASSEHAQTDSLARMPVSEARRSRKSQPLQSEERTTRDLHPRQAEIALSAHVQIDTDQPLVVRGTTLEAYLPAPLAAPSRSVQRWTTHLATELEPLPVVRKIPLEPCPPPQPGAEELPGRTAIYKASRSVPVAQAIQQMERRARLVFILLDGRRTIQDIARLIRQAEYDVEQILVNLAQRGYAHYMSG